MICKWQFDTPKLCIVASLVHVHCSTHGSMEIPKLLSSSSVSVASLVSLSLRSLLCSLHLLSLSLSLYRSPHCWPYLHNIEHCILWFTICIYTLFSMELAFHCSLSVHVRLVHTMGAAFCHLSSVHV